MNPFHVLIVTEHFFPHIGGVEKFFLDLVQGLMRRGIQVRVVTSNSGGITGHHRFEGVEVYSYAWISFAGHPIPSLRDMREHVLWADIIHTTTYTAAPMANLAGKKYQKPVLVTIHEVLGEKWAWIEKNPVLQVGYRLFERFVVTRSYDYLICDSKATQKDLQNLKALQDKAVTVYLSVESDKLNAVRDNRQALCEFAGIGNDTVVFLYYGRPGQPKGIFVLLEAIRLAVPRIERKRVRFLFIISAQPQKERLRFLKKVREYGLEDCVVIRDSQPRAKLFEYVKSCDFVVVPSITEGFGFTTAESCQLGKKVIHSDGGSLPEVASGLTLSFKNRDSADLADKLVYAASGREFTRSPLHSFTADRMVEEYLRIYERMGGEKA